MYEYSIKIEHTDKNLPRHALTPAPMQTSLLCMQYVEGKNQGGKSGLSSQSKLKDTTDVVANFILLTWRETITPY